MPIGAGAFNERVQIRTAAVVRDAFGGEVQGWSTVATVWARIVERGGREPVLADRPVMVVSYEVTIRAGVTVTNKDRLLWGSKTLMVDTVTPHRTDGTIVLRCIEAEA